MNLNYFKDLRTIYKSVPFFILNDEFISSTKKKSQCREINLQPKATAERFYTHALVL